MLTPYVKQLITGHSLSFSQAKMLMREILQSNEPELIAAILVLLRAKTETAAEIAAFVTVLREHQLTIHVSDPVVDIVGTGGDGLGTANISTMAAVLAAACGAHVLKHGNRAISSKSGSADVLEALGYNIEVKPHDVEASLLSNRFGFCFAPLFNPLFQKFKQIRQQLKVPTLFNLVGPLLNPGRAQVLLLGVSEFRYLSVMADCLIMLGVSRAMVVQGHGLDELSTIGPCHVIEITSGKTDSYMLDPRDLGLPYCELQDLVGGNANINASLMKRVMSGDGGHLSHTVLLNTGSALYLSGLANSIAEGVGLARDSIASGHAKQYLEELSHA